jgi:hypothetical protein
LSQTSRAKRSAVKVITDSRKSRLRVDQLIAGLFGELSRRLRETAQAYAHYRPAKGGPRGAAPFTTDEQIIHDTCTAFVWNRYAEKHYPDENARLALRVPHDRGGLRFVDKGDPAAITAVDRECRDLTAKEFCQIGALVLELSSTPVDPVAFRAEANPAWDKLRHRVLGQKVKGDLELREQQVDPAENQAAQFRRRVQNVHDKIEGQIRADPDCKDVATGWRHVWQRGLLRPLTRRSAVDPE